MIDTMEKRYYLHWERHNPVTGKWIDTGSIHIVADPSAERTACGREIPFPDGDALILTMTYEHESDCRMSHLGAKSCVNCLTITERRERNARKYPVT